MADKYLRWEPSTGRTTETEATVVSAGAGDAGEIVALGADGRIDESVLPSGVGAAVFVLEADEALSAGEFVNVFDDGGTIKVRLADASNGRQADGYVTENVLAAAMATVHYGDVNTELSALTAPGTYYLSDSTPGGVQTPAPTASGAIVQRLGKAISATELVVDMAEVVIELA